MMNKIEKNDENGENNVLLFKPSLVMLCYIYICSWSSYFLTCRDTISLLQTNSPFHLWSRSFSSDNGDLVEAVVPFMGESITDGTLAKFLKQPGDRVEVDEPIAQVETDKVTIDVASPEAGVLQKVKYSESALSVSRKFSVTS